MEQLIGIKKYLISHKLLCDGAFGTYYAGLCRGGEGSIPERANVEQPELVKRIHKDYLRAGAGLLRSNTFAANRGTLGCGRRELEENLRSAVRLAQEAVLEYRKEPGGAEDGREIFVAGDIGPLPHRFSLDKQELTEEYLWIASVLLEAGVDLLVFETFADYEVILEVGKKLKREQDVFLVMQFSVNQHGYTNAGLSAGRILRELGSENCIDAIGFNCGVGPGHLVHIMENAALPSGKFLTAFPNASYPKVIGEQLVFQENKEYFVNKAAVLADLGADLIGGCCGTDPSYIEGMSGRVDLKQRPHRSSGLKMGVPGSDKIKTESRIKNSAFFAGRNAEYKLLAVELAPPFHADDKKIREASQYLKEHYADVVTFPDSPSGRTRADSIMTGIKVAQHTGMCVMPHICCRDKNAIAIRAQLLGAYMNGIRNLLVVTGDPVPAGMRGDIRSVYNFDSIGLMKIIREMNADEFAQDPIVYGGALSYNRRNLEVEIERMHKKMEAGAEFFLTQPLFTQADAERLRLVQEKVPCARILCGIMPLVSRRNALFIQNEMAGIQVTDEIIDRYREDMTREEGEMTGAAIAGEIMEMTRDFAAGYYFSIPFNRVGLLEKIPAGVRNEQGF